MARPRKTKEALELAGMSTKHAVYKTYGSSAQCEKLTPVKPAFRNEETNNAWTTIVPALEALKVLTVQDFTTLDEMFRTYEMYVDSCKLLDQFTEEWNRSNGVIDKDFLDKRKSLIVQISTTQNDFNKLASRFGLSPTDRSRLDIRLEREETPMSVFLDNFINGK